MTRTPAGQLTVRRFHQLAKDNYMSTMDSSRSLSYSNYADPGFVQKYAASIRDNAWNAFYERPASLSLLPPLKDLDVLDAGCGPGAVSQLLVQAGARVTAADYSAPMLEATLAATGNAVTCLLQDLNEPLVLDDASFDAIYCALVIHYVDDLHLLFSEFARVLRPQGVLVFSTDHPENPLLSGREPERKHFSEVEWASFSVRMQVYQRPWREIEQACLANGLHIEQVLEPKPLAEAEQTDPEAYAYLSKNKHFICVRTVKR
ncbi:SAM-dependent methyltransferase [Pedobacter yulinensis]|uniref:SAM-dependent methyltransferase n=1 Tax=Pedobacter yulinensis TaxID=2126353 RepID=A0A2T3HM72_9SPHI|nr:class I SAM-dependent methyltransferase [Pedobacter yulinensis]PST83558.1 SAM-dependent methyltransferase [Pedobacter yulinensis]